MELKVRGGIDKPVSRFKFKKFYNFKNSYVYQLFTGRV